MRMGSVIYHCRKTSDEYSDVLTYASPQTYHLRLNYLTVMPASGYKDVVAYGEKISRKWNMIARTEDFEGVFHEGDLLYIDGATPKSGKPNGDGANAVVDSVRYQNHYIQIVLEKQDL